MIKEFHKTSKEIELTINVQMALKNLAKESVSEYIEVRRVAVSWTAFGKLAFILKNRVVPINPRRNVYEVCILQVTTKAHSANGLGKAQRAMGHAILELSLSRQLEMEKLEEEPETDIMERVASLRYRTYH